MTVYALGEYDARKMHANSAESAAGYRAEMAGLPVAELPDGVRMHVGDHYLFFTRGNALDYAARCRRSKPAPKVNPFYCSTGYQIEPGLGLIYDFRADEVGFEQRAAAVDRMARELFGSLKAQ